MGATRSRWRANSIAADGISAAVAVYQSNFAAPVTFQASSGGGVLVSAYDPNYLTNPSSSGSSQVVVTPTCNVYGSCLALALIWPPEFLPFSTFQLTQNTLPALGISVPATQSGVSTPGALGLYPPPLLLVHGIWSSPSGSGFYPGAGGFYNWISGIYPHPVITPVDYSQYNYLAYSTPSTQSEFTKSMGILTIDATHVGLVARTVDVFVHSMGGLVTRYWMENEGNSLPYLPAKPIHKLITIGTPHQGTALANKLYDDQNYLPVTALAFEDYTG